MYITFCGDQADNRMSTNKEITSCLAQQLSPMVKAIMLVSASASTTVTDLRQQWRSLVKGPGCLLLCFTDVH